MSRRILQLFTVSGGVISGAGVRGNGVGRRIRVCTLTPVFIRQGDLVFRSRELWTLPATSKLPWLPQSSIPGIMVAAKRLEYHWGVNMEDHGPRS